MFKEVILPSAGRLAGPVANGADVVKDIAKKWENALYESQKVNMSILFKQPIPAVLQPPLLCIPLQCGINVQLVGCSKSIWRSQLTLSGIAQVIRTPARLLSLG